MQAWIDISQSAQKMRRTNDSASCEQRHRLALISPPLQRVFATVFFVTVSLMLFGFVAEAFGIDSGLFEPLAVLMTIGFVALFGGGFIAALVGPFREGLSTLCQGGEKTVRAVRDLVRPQHGTRGSAPGLARCHSQSTRQDCRSDDLHRLLRVRLDDRRLHRLAACRVADVIDLQ